MGAATLELPRDQNQNTDALQEELKQIKLQLESSSTLEIELKHQIDILNQEKALVLQEKVALSNVSLLKYSLLT